MIFSFPFDDIIKPHGVIVVVLNLWLGPVYKRALVNKLVYVALVFLALDSERLASFYYLFYAYFLLGALSV